MKIQVKAEHIEAGESHSPYRCPIAMSIHDELGTKPETFDVQVHYERIKIGKKWYLAPPEVSNFVVLFDGGGKRLVSPFAFELPIDE